MGVYKEAIEVINALVEENEKLAQELTIFKKEAGENEQKAKAMKIASVLNLEDGAVDKISSYTPDQVSALEELGSEFVGDQGFASGTFTKSANSGNDLSVAREDVLNFLNS